MYKDKFNDIFQLALVNCLGLFLQPDILSLLPSIYFMLMNWMGQKSRKNSFLQYQGQYLLAFYCALSLMTTIPLHVTKPPERIYSLPMEHHIQKFDFE